MPRMRSLVRRRRRRGRSYRAVRRYSRSRVPRMPCRTAWPLTMKVKLRYGFAVDITAVGNQNYSFSMNSLYDPNTTGTGHQPYGHDQWAAIYANYMVYSSAIVVNHTTSAGSLAHTCALSPSTTAAPSMDAIGMAERPGSQFRVVPPSSGATMKTSAPLSKYLNPLDATIHGAVVGYDPTVQYYWVITQTPFGGTTWDIQITGTVTYYVTFSNPRAVAQS